MRLLARFTAQGSTPTAKQDRAFLVEKYKPHFRKITDFMLYMYTDIPEYEQLMQELKEYQLKGDGFFERIWSEDEVNSAEFLIMNTSFDIDDPLSGKDFNASFKEICGRCGVLEQTSDLKIKKKYVGKWDFFSSYEMRSLASPRMKELLEQEGFPGLQFRPVFTGKIDEPVAWQLIVKHALPPVHPDSQLRIAVDCPDCGFKSYVYSWTEPVTYGSEIRKQAIDGFNRSFEPFGAGWYCRPIIIVPQRIRQFLLPHKLKGINFEPVIIKE